MATSPIQTSTYAHYIKHADYAAHMADWLATKKADQFVDLFLKLSLVPDIFSLYEWSNWHSPDIESVRFNAIFFICSLKNMPEAHNIRIDSGESQTLEVFECSRVG
jgi:hypothetical protein